VSPDILGASTGAGFGAALSILFGMGYFAISASSFVFGVMAIASAYIISGLSRADVTLAMILSGMVISSLFAAGISLIKLVADTGIKLPAITYWLMGMLSSIKVVDLQFIIIPIAIGMIPLFFLRWRLNLLTMEEESAKTTGVNITALRLLAVACATLLTAASVSVSGMIGWVGLVIPHLCRMIFGYDYRRLIPATAIFGATFLLIVDDIARTVTTQEIPIGILTAFVGSPLFLYLLLTRGGKRR
jgi:iron complex transport system permease protein